MKPSFLTGVEQTAHQAALTALSIHNYLQRYPIANTHHIKEACGVSLPTVLRALALLESLGLIREMTGKERHRIFIYQAYLDILNEGVRPFG